MFASKMQMMPHYNYKQQRVFKSRNIAYINSSFSLVYDQTKCARDVGYIVDAPTYDILYGGNSATRVNAESYFVGETPNYLQDNKHKQLMHMIIWQVYIL